MVCSWRLLESVAIGDELGSVRVEVDMLTTVGSMVFHDNLRKLVIFLAFARRLAVICRFLRRRGDVGTHSFIVSEPANWNS